MAVIFEEEGKTLNFFSYLMWGNFGRGKWEYLVAIELEFRERSKVEEKM